ncbi:MAG: preprotein translocase subunit SecE [bacterium]
MKLILAALIVAAAVAIYYQFSDWLQVARVGVVLLGVAVAAAIALTTESGRATMVFAKGANVERQKMVWPGRREAMQVTGLVVLMVIVFGLYLWLLDSLSFYGIYNLVLGLRSA